MGTQRNTKYRTHTAGDAGRMATDATLSMTNDMSTTKVVRFRVGPTRSRTVQTQCAPTINIANIGMKRSRGLVATAAGDARTIGTYKNDRSAMFTTDSTSHTFSSQLAMT